MSSKKFITYYADYTISFATQKSQIKIYGPRITGSSTNTVYKFQTKYNTSSGQPAIAVMLAVNKNNLTYNGHPSPLSDMFITLVHDLHFALLQNYTLKSCQVFSNEIILKSSA